MISLLKDFSYGCRMMRRTPLFTGSVVLTVALAIAANTTIFSFVKAVLLAPVSVPGAKSAGSGGGEERQAESEKLRRIGVELCIVEGAGAVV
jgi:hypothetical protein